MRFDTLVWPLDLALPKATKAVSHMQNDGATLMRRKFASDPTETVIASNGMTLTAQ